MEAAEAPSESAKPSSEEVVLIENLLGIEGNFALDHYLFNISKENFQTLWGNQSNMLDLEKPHVTIPRLAGIYVLFFKFDQLSSVIKRNKQIYGDGLKRNNIWYNEIRENTLLNLFDIDTNKFSRFLMDNLGRENEITINILELYQEWISTLLQCGYLEMKKFKEAPHASSSSAKAPPPSEELSKAPLIDEAADNSSTLGDVDLPRIEESADNISSSAKASSLEDYPFVIRSIQKRGGQGYPYDFELMISENFESEIQILVKIEFKFSGSAKTSIMKLAQFGSANTESEGALILLFGGESYLDFFWNKPTNSDDPNSPTFFQKMCLDVNYNGLRDLFLEQSFDPDVFNSHLGFDKDTWKNVAKAVDLKGVKDKDSPICHFHTFLRGNEMKNEDKKVTVNNSLGQFITANIRAIKSRLREIEAMFNEKQGGKYFCIFSNGEFSISTMPTFNIVDVQQVGDTFIFEFSTTSQYKIKCDMSWGNGGAGNQNPRILFKLLEVGHTEDENEDNEEGDDVDTREVAEKPPRKPKSPKDPLLEAAKLQAKAQVKQAKEQVKQLKQVTKTLASQAVKDAIEQVKSRTAAKIKAEAEAKLNKKGGDDSDSEEDEEDDSDSEEDEEDDYDWFTMHEELALGDENADNELLKVTGATITTKKGIEGITQFATREKNIRLKEWALKNKENILNPEILTDETLKFVKENYKYSGDKPTDRVTQMVLNKKAEVGQGQKKGGKKTKKTNIKKIKKTKRIKKLKKLTKRKNKKNKRTKRR